MAKKRKPSFDPKSFLARIDDGSGVGKYRRDQIVFAQGDPADAVFYVQKGKVKLTVVSEQGKEAVIAILGPDEFFGRGMPGRADAAYRNGHDHDGFRDRATGKDSYP